LGFDDLQIFKKDSLGRIDTLQAAIQPVTASEMNPVNTEVVSEKPKVNQNPKTTAKAVKKTAEKPKPSPEAIRKWKEKVAAQKASQKAKPDQAAIDRWKAKVAAQKALDKKKKSTNKKAAQPKKQQ
jgi:hypothetical protein